jgi:hypothetical protein
MKTFLVEDFLLERQQVGVDTGDEVPDGRGNLAGVPAGIRKLLS